MINLKVGHGNLGPRGMVGRIYLGDYLISLHTLSVSSGAHGYRD